MSTSQLPDRIPFVYVIRDVLNNKRYAGVKFSKGCDPKDILTNYFTSSKIVKQLIKEGREFVVDRTIEFDSKENAMEFEELLLKTVNAHTSDEWYNLAAGKAINPDIVREKCLEKYGVPNASSTPEVRDKVSNSCQERYGANSMFESIHFKEKSLISMNNRHGVDYSMQSPELREKSKNTLFKNYGVFNPSQISKNRELHSRLMKEKNKVKIICETCGISVDRGNYSRWHGIKCKHK